MGLGGTPFPGWHACSHVTKCPASPTAPTQSGTPAPVCTHSLSPTEGGKGDFTDWKVWEQRTTAWSWSFRSAVGICHVCRQHGFSPCLAGGKWRPVVWEGKLNSLEGQQFFSFTLSHASSRASTTVKPILIPSVYNSRVGLCYNRLRTPLGK